MIPHAGLFRKYLRAIGGLVSLLLLGAAAAMVTISVQEQHHAVERLLSAEARYAAARVETFLAQLTDALAWVGDYQQQGQDKQLREQVHHLLQKAPPIMELLVVEDLSRVRLRFSRVDVDCMRACADAELSIEDSALMESAAHEQRPVFGKVRFRDGWQPLIPVALATRGGTRQGLLAEIDLRQIQSTVSALRIGQTGYIQLVDSQWQLVAHPDPSQVLRHLDLRSSPAVQAAFGTAPGIATMTRALDGKRILLAVAAVPSTRWWVFAEQPVAEAFAPVFTVMRTLAIAILLALALAVGLSFLLARHMALPILALRAGAAHLAAGHLDTRIDIATGDEVGLLADEFNNMAAALAHSHAELEQRVEARTHALSAAGVQLQQQADELAAANAELSKRAAVLSLHGEQLERASAAKTRFLAAASHDLLQPMHAVGLLVDILNQRAQPAGSGPLLEKLQGAVRGMESLFASLLDISRLDAKQVEANLRPVDLGQLFTFLEVRYQQLAAAKGLVLRVVTCDWVVRTDPVLLERILGNLLSNAIRYTARGGILLGCRRAGPNVEVIVYDTGSGIAPQDQIRIYDEFVQLGRSERDRNQGLGLGLAIVHRSAALLGHPLSLRSVVQRGSAFGIRLPCLPHQPAAEPSGTAAPVVPPSLIGAFVVLIDDDADSRYAMEQVFHTWSCHVVSAATVSQALARMQHHLRIPDLIVTDWRLPDGANGLDAIASLRKMSEETTPGLLLTADANPPHAADLPACCKVASKPVNVRRMLELLTELLAPSVAPPYI